MPKSSHDTFDKKEQAGENSPPNSKTSESFGKTSELIKGKFPKLELGIHAHVIYDIVSLWINEGTG